MTDHRRQFRAIKGTRDILPPDSALWNWFEQTARDVFDSYNFREIRLPIFEETSLFARSVGTDTDIVNKEMYTFEDRSAEIEWPFDLVSLTKFIEDIERTMNSGEMPLSFDNQEFLRKIKSYLANEERLMSQPVDEALMEAWKAHSKHHWQFLHLARTLQLGEWISLRPEATASVARAYIENGMQTLPGNAKLYYIGPMFRRERP